MVFGYWKNKNHIILTSNHPERRDRGTVHQKGTFTLYIKKLIFSLVIVYISLMLKIFIIKNANRLCVVYKPIEWNAVKESYRWPKILKLEYTNFLLSIIIYINIYAHTYVLTWFKSKWISFNTKNERNHLINLNKDKN